MEGWRALTERLGPAGAMRFMMQYDTGYGDYTKERQNIFAELTIDTLLDAIDERARPEDPADPISKKTSNELLRIPV